MLIALLSVLPFAAILHHAVFFRHTCMLNSFGASDYTLHWTSVWLRSDPSLPFAITIALILYLVGRSRPRLRKATKYFNIAFAPLALWIWDIPGSGRIICHHFHDGRIALHSLHLYVLGLVIWLALVTWLLLGATSDTGYARQPSMFGRY